MKRIIFENNAFEDFVAWSKDNKKLYARIVQLIKDIQRSPFSGIGKPEPLRFELSGFWFAELMKNIGWFTKLQMMPS